VCGLVRPNPILGVTNRVELPNAMTFWAKNVRV